MCALHAWACPPSLTRADASPQTRIHRLTLFRPVLDLQHERIAFWQADIHRHDPSEPLLAHYPSEFANMPLQGHVIFLTHAPNRHDRKRPGRLVERVADRQTDLSYQQVLCLRWGPGCRNKNSPCSIAGTGQVNPLACWDSVGKHRSETSVPNHRGVSSSISARGLSP